MPHESKVEMWSSRWGVILAVAGNAIGLGNFLRFPGLAAQYGSGAFMIAYFISLLLLGIPIAWAEWTLGRHAGQHGYRSSPGIFHVLIRHPAGKYIGALGVIIPVIVYMYYVYIEAWCVGYMWYFLTGKLNLGGDVAAYENFWKRFVGATENGLALGGGQYEAVVFLAIVFALNLLLIYRGLARGIEWFCKWAIPALMVLAIIVLARVLTLGTPDPAKPGQNLLNGLGYMWNPGSSFAAVLQQLKNPALWLAAAGQIFFTLGVGFGIIITYASYLRRRDDVVLSSLTANSANEFAEVALGGMITVPAAFVFLGAAGIIGQGTFGLGFKVLPLVLAKMPWPAFFGSAFFFLLFLAAITSSLAMLQPGIAFLEEALGIGRKKSVASLAMVTGIGCAFVVYFSKDLKALDTLDFWVGTFLLFVMATIIIIVFGWVMGIEKGWAEAHQGAEIRIPNIFKFIIKYVSPLYLLAIFVMWVLKDVFGWNPDTGQFKPTGYVLDLIGSSEAPPSAVARWSVVLIAVSFALTVYVVSRAAKRWPRPEARKENLP